MKIFDTESIARFFSPASNLESRADKLVRLHLGDLIEIKREGYPPGTLGEVMSLFDPADDATDPGPSVTLLDPPHELVEHLLNSEWRLHQRAPELES